jgi:hypothetical protein
MYYANFLLILPQRYSLTVVLLWLLEIIGCYSGQFINKFFAPDEETLQQDLLSGQVNLDTKRYNLDYGTFVC